MLFPDKIKSKYILILCNLFNCLIDNRKISFNLLWISKAQIILYFERKKVVNISYFICKSIRFFSGRKSIEVDKEACLKKKTN